jgi:hypothetical protein
MSFKRLVLLAAFGVLVLGLATAVQAKQWALSGGGAQVQIGNGLALPIQAAPIATATGGGPGTTWTAFPGDNPITASGATGLNPRQLRIKVATGAPPVVTGTTAKPLLTAMTTSPMGALGTKVGYQRKLVVQPGALTRAGTQRTVGLKFSNAALYAVATNLNWVWPAATKGPAVFSTGTNAVGGGGAGTFVVAGLGGTMTYSNALGNRFGGPGWFVLSPGAPAGLFPRGPFTPVGDPGTALSAPVTLYIKINPTATPPCTHNVPWFGGANPGCIAGLMLAKPTGFAGVGGTTGTTVMTPGAPIPGFDVAAVKMGVAPLGTMLPGVAPPALTPPYPIPVAATPLPTNMATSQPGPWTTGRLVVSMPGVGEKFTLEGKDMRTAQGGGTIQLVSGALSQRATSGPNADRGWLRLKLSPNWVHAPAASPGAIAAGAALMLLAFGYATRRWLSA